MTTTAFPAFPHLFDPPADIARRLREEDAAVELVYFGWGKWYLVRYNPRSFAVEMAHRALYGRPAEGENAAAPGIIALLEQWRALPRMRANPGAFRRLYGRYLYWTLVRLGGQPIAEYDRLFIRKIGFEHIVTDFRQMQWMYRTMSDTAVDAALNHDADEKEAAPSPLADEHYAKDAARYLFTRTHAITRLDDPAKTPRPRSGFTRAAIAGRDAVAS